MATIVRVGHSRETDTQRAVEAAMREAASTDPSARATFGVLFCSPRHRLGLALATARGLGECPFLGCTTAGEITRLGLYRGSVGVMLVTSDSMLCAPALARGLGGGGADAAARLCEPFRALADASAARGLAHPLTLLLTDGLSGAGEGLLRHLVSGTRPFLQIAGAGAGDDGALKETLVGVDTEAQSDAAAALHLFSAGRFGIGVGHGLRPISRPLQVTRSCGPVLHQLEGRPALEVYSRYAGEPGAELTGASVCRDYLMEHPLGLYGLGAVRKIRAPIQTGPEGALICAADVPEGSSVSIMAGGPERAVAAAETAACEALKHLEGGEAAGVLIFDCMGRVVGLGKDFRLALAGVRRVFPQAPILGMVSYGEIARARGRVDGWHNVSVVVVAIPRS